MVDINDEEKLNHVSLKFQKMSLSNFKQYTFLYHTPILTWL